MPIPVPKSEDDLGACIRHVRRTQPDTKQNEWVAICLDVYRRAHGKTKPKKKE